MGILAKNVSAEGFVHQDTQTDIPGNLSLSQDDKLEEGTDYHLPYQHMQPSLIRRLPDSPLQHSETPKNESKLGFSFRSILSNKEVSDV